MTVCGNGIYKIVINKIDIGKIEVVLLGKLGRYIAVDGQNFGFALIGFIYADGRNLVVLDNVINL